MPIQFHCTCGRKFQVEERFAGRKTKCPVCGVTILIPDQTETGDAFNPAVEPELEPAAPPRAPAPGMSPDLQLEVEPTVGSGRHDVVPPTPQPPASASKKLETAAPIKIAAESEAIPLEAAPASPAPPPEEPQAKCPRCNAPCTAESVICVECGFRLMTAGAAKSGNALEQAKRFVAARWKVLAVAALALVAVGTLAVTLLPKSRFNRGSSGQQTSTTVAAVTATTDAPAPTTTTLPPPKPEWAGLSNPDLALRARLRAAAKAIAENASKTGAAPATLAEAGLSAEQAADITYAGKDIAGIKRRTVWAYAPRPDGNGKYVLFSDGRVAPMTDEQLARVMPQQTPEGLFAPVEAETLAMIAPMLRVLNGRPMPVSVEIAGRPAVSVAPGRTGAWPLPPGNQEIRLTLGGVTVAVAVEGVRGVLACVSLPSNEQLPYVPMRIYRNAMNPAMNVPGYTMEREGTSIKALAGLDERVIFGEMGGRLAISMDLKTLQGRIEQKRFTLQGADGEPLRLNEIGRLQDGVATFSDGRIIRYRSTPLGVVAQSVTPRTDLAALAGPGRLPDAPEPESEAPVEPADDGTLKQTLNLVETPVIPSADIETLAPLLRAPQALAMLLQATASLGAVDMEMESASGCQAPRSEELCPRPSPEAIFGTLAVISDPATLRSLASLADALPPETPGYNQLVMAMGRCGGSALASLTVARQRAPVAAIVALALTADNASHNALNEAIGDCSAESRAQLLALWPPMAGPAARQRFIAAATVRPELRNRPDVLAWLYAFDAQALAGTLQERLLASTTATAGDTLWWAVPVQRGLPETYSHLVGLLSGGDSAAKTAALEALGEATEPNVIQPAAELLGDADTLVQQAAAVSLARMGSAGAAAALTQRISRTMATPPLLDACENVVQRAGADAATPLLAKLLQAASQIPAEGEAAPDEAVTPVQALERIAQWRLPAAGFAAGLKAAHASEDPATRLAAFRVEAGGPVPVRGPEAMTIALAALKDADETVRAFGAELLGRCDPAAALPLLEKTSADQSAPVREAVMRALGALSSEDPRITALLNAGLADADLSVVSAAATSAAAGKRTGAISALIAALNRPPAEGQPRDAALPALIRAAGALRAQEAASSVGLLLTHAEPSIRQAAAEVLGGMNDPASVTALAAAAQDPDDAVAQASIRALIVMSNSPAHAALAGAIQERELPDELRRAAIKTVIEAVAAGRLSWPGDQIPNEANLKAVAEIADTAPKEWRPALLKVAMSCLREPQEATLAAANTIMLAISDDPQVRNAVLASLETDGSALPKAAAAILRNMKDPTQVDDLARRYKKLWEASTKPDLHPGLAKASAEDNLELRTAIIAALGNIHSDESARALRQLMGFEGVNLADAILRALEDTGSAAAVRYIGEYAARPDPCAAPAARALGRVGALSRGLAMEALTRAMKGMQAPPDAAAAAMDAIEALSATGGGG